MVGVTRLRALSLLPSRRHAHKLVVKALRAVQSAAKNLLIVWTDSRALSLLPSRRHAHKRVVRALRAVQSEAPACRRSGRISKSDGQTPPSVGVTRLGAFTSDRQNSELCHSERSEESQYRMDRLPSFVITPFTQACAQAGREGALRRSERSEESQYQMDRLLLRSE